MNFIKNHKIHYKRNKTVSIVKLLFITVAERKSIVLVDGNALSRKSHCNCICRNYF